VPRHALSLAELGADELDDVARAWRDRARAARAAGFRYLHAFVNEGRTAGASRPHTHSQLVWLPGPPPAVLEEDARAARCQLCAVLAAERAGGERLVLEEDEIVAVCPFASSVPYELLVAPRACEADAFESELLASALAGLAESIRRLRATVPGAPLNAWLHTGTVGDGRAHWHLHALPRLTVSAGVELGAGIAINPLPPEQAAATLREAAGRA
jgi:UDPglucose--hexose-1-phosphate uridylyltransferase